MSKMLVGYLTGFDKLNSFTDVSGVMAVVLLGLTLRAERTVISPDSEGRICSKLFACNFDKSNIYVGGRKCPPFLVNYGISGKHRAVYVGRNCNC